MKAPPAIFGYMGGVFKLPLAQGPMVPQYWGRATEPTHCGSAAVSGFLGPCGSDLEQCGSGTECCAVHFQVAQVPVLTVTLRCLKWWLRSQGLAHRERHETIVKQTHTRNHSLND